MANINVKWSEIRILPVSAMKTDPLYKRHLDMSRVSHIVNNFDADLIGIPWVSYRDGGFFILDGQHLVKALAIKFNNPNYPISCKVYHGLTEQGEIELCMKLMASMKPIDAFSSIKMQTFIGDESTRMFLQCTKDAGFAINRANQRNSPYSIRAIKKAQECFQVLGAKKYMFMLNTLRKTWHGAPWSVSSKMLSGMCLLLRFADINQERFANRLSKFTEADITNLVYQNCKHLKRNHSAWVLGMLYDDKLNLSMLDFI